MQAKEILMLLVALKPTIVMMKMKAEAAWVARESSAINNE